MLKSIRNSLVFTSILYVAIGVILLAFPGAALDVSCMVIGAVTLVYGAVRIIAYFRGGGAYSQRFDLLTGVVLAALGVFLLVSPRFLAAVIPVFLGLYILVDSLTAMKKALDMKALGFDKWWISFLAALALAVFGVVVVCRPFAAVSTLVMFIGAGFVFDGVYTLVNTIVADRVFRG